MGTAEQMQQLVLSLLNEKLPAHFSYHNTDHTLYVQLKAEEIARQEQCTEEEIKLIRTAALWHDVGCIVSFYGHEEESCKIAQQYLPLYDFSENEIAVIFGIIRATKIPQSPTNRLEEIVADADLEYLGTDLAAPLAQKLYEELLHLHPQLTKEQWNHVQISFLQKHQYFTAYCRNVKEPAKQDYLNSLKNNLN